MRRVCWSVLVLAALMPWAQAQNVSEQYLLAAANQDRAARQLAPLRIDERLTQAARLHAYEMAKRERISHQFAGEAELAKRAGGTGARFSLVTENVAEASNSALIHELWMKSAGHRTNLLDPAVDSVGIAVVQRNGQLYAVEDFARTTKPISFDDQERTVAAALESRGLNVTVGSRDARETCRMSTGYAGSRQPWFVMRYTSADINELPQELTTRITSGRYEAADVGACVTGNEAPFTAYSIAVLLYP